MDFERTTAVWENSNYQPSIGMGSLGPLPALLACLSGHPVPAYGYLQVKVRGHPSVEGH